MLPKKGDVTYCNNWWALRYYQYEEKFSPAYCLEKWRMQLAVSCNKRNLVSDMKDHVMTKYLFCNK